jgi:hypothetical protein
LPRAATAAACDGVNGPDERAWGGGDSMRRRQSSREAPPSAINRRLKVLPGASAHRPGARFGEPPHVADEGKWKQFPGLDLQGERCGSQTGVPPAPGAGWVFNRFGGVEKIFCLVIFVT